MLTKISNYLKTNNEYFSIGFALVIMIVSPSLIRLMDPTAMPPDPGALGLIIMAVVAVMVFLATTWFIITQTWAGIREYFEDHFLRNFKTLTPCQKVVISLALYFALFFSFLVALAALA